MSGCVLAVLYNMAEVLLCAEDVQAIITGIATHPEALASVAQLISQANQRNESYPPQQQQPTQQPTKSNSRKLLSTASS